MMADLASSFEPMSILEQGSARGGKLLGSEVLHGRLRFLSWKSNLVDLLCRCNAHRADLETKDW